MIAKNESITIAQNAQGARIHKQLCGLVIEII
jgi:hypothetical protein